MGKGQAIIGLVLGIVALVLSFLSALPFVSFIALVLAIVALILSVIGGKKLAANNQPKGVATGGLVVGNQQTQQAAGNITDTYEGEDVVIDMSELLQ